MDGWGGWGPKQKWNGWSLGIGSHGERPWGKSRLEQGCSAKDNDDNNNNNNNNNNNINDMLHLI